MHKIGFLDGRNRAQFTIKHSARELLYDSTDFIDKNTNSPQSISTELFKRSTNTLLAKLYSLKEDSVQKSTSNFEPVKEQQDNFIQQDIKTNSIKFQLSNLFKSLDDTNISCIYCIKPNESQASEQFESVDVVRQLRYMNICEVLQVRRNCYFESMTYESFMQRFSKLGPNHTLKDNQDIGDLLNNLVWADHGKKKLKNSWAFGKTKLFLSKDISQILLEKLYLVGILTLKRAMRKSAFQTLTSQLIPYRKEIMALKIFKNWKLCKQNKAFFIARGKWRAVYSHLKRKKIIDGLSQTGYDGHHDNLSEVRHTADTFSFTGVSKFTSKSHTRDNSTVEVNLRDVIKKLQDELSHIRHENLELRSKDKTSPSSRLVHFL